MRIDRPTIARLTALVGIPISLLASGLIVSTASYSAFTADTSNPADNWTTGTVQLADDDAGTALFTVTGLKPGLTGSNCIRVTSTGTLPAAVKLYATGPATTNALSAALTLTIEQGIGGGFGSCSGFTADTVGGTLFTGPLSTFALPTSGYSNGVGSWTTTGTGTESKVYRISYTLPTSTPSTAQGLTTTATFTWEAQNT